MVGLRDGLLALGYHGKFQELNVQILGISADNPFAQKTFADSLS
jgi:peroxiredoxin